MKPNEIFKMVSNLDYQRNTADFDWAVKVDDEEKIIWVAVQASMSWLDWVINLLFFWIPQVRQWAHWSDLITYMPPLPGYWNVKVIRLGEFSLKGLFNPEKYHQIYDDEKLYEGKI